MEMISMDSLITKIMNFAQKLVDADRASLFLVDSKTNQLYARIFDIKKKPRIRQIGRSQGGETSSQVSVATDENGDDDDDDDFDDEDEDDGKNTKDISREIRYAIDLRVPFL